MATCARCGGEVQEGDAFCRNCGATAGSAPAPSGGPQPWPMSGAPTQVGEDAVWPDGAPALDPFEPIEGRARWAKTLLGLNAALSVVGVFLFLERATAIETFDSTNDISDWVTSDDHFALFALPQAVVAIATIVLFLVWFHRAYKNLPALGVRRLRYTPGWSIGAWFVPFLNLVRPKAIANDIWKGSDPELPAETADWRQRPVGAVVHWWWAIYLLSIITITATVGEVNTLEAEARNARIDSVRSLVSVVAAVLAIRMISGVTERQRERAERAGAA